MIALKPNAFAAGGQSIQRRLQWLVVAVTLPIVLLFASFRVAEWQRLRQSAVESVGTLARHTATGLGRELNEQAALLGRIASRPGVRALDPARCDPVLRHFDELNAALASLAAVDLQGRIRCASRVGAAIADADADAPRLAAGLHAAQFAISEPFAAQPSGRATALLTQPLRDDVGAVAGLLVMWLDLQRLGDRSLHDAPARTQIDVVDPSGHIVFGSDRHDEQFGGRLELRHEDLAQRHGDGTFTASGADGVHRQYAYASVPGANWRVFASLPDDDIFAAQAVAIARGAVIGLAVLALVAWLASRIGRAIAEPIRQLSGVAARVAGGDRHARAALSGPAEIGDVARALNHLLDVQWQAEEALLASQARLRALAELSSDWTWEQDADMRITHLSLLGEQGSTVNHGVIVGYARREAPGVRWGEAELVAFEALCRARRPFRHFELTRHYGDGPPVYVQLSGRPVLDSRGAFIGYRGVGTDITERKLAEARLHSAEAQTRMMFESSLDAVFRTRPDGGIVDANPAACAMFKLSLGDLRRGGHKAVVALDDTRVAALVREREHHGHARGEITMLRGDGTRFEAEVSTSTYRDADGSLLSGVIVRDISERHAAERLRARLEAQLRESQKMEAIGTLAGGIAHDFNNIVGAIFGNVALARDDVAPDHPAQASLTQIHKASLRARSLVEKILAFGRGGAHTPEVQAARPLVEESLALLRATLPAAVQLEARLADAPLYLMADATQIEQVLLNLCTNAWHALKGSTGRIEVLLAEAELPVPGRPLPAGLEAGRYVHMAVIDDGCGIDPLVRERIFDPFFTTKPVGQGSGLGLSVVHGIVASHRGAITVASAPGKGARFDLYFPAIDSHTLPAPLDSAPALAQAGRGERVLYLDDDETLVTLFERLLARQGYQVTCFRDGVSALQALAREPAEFDIVVSDFNMPGLSGLDIAREVRRRRAGLPVILVSGNVTDELLASAAQAGVRRVVLKERAFDELAPAIGLALAGAGG